MLLLLLMMMRRRMRMRMRMRMMMMMMMSMWPSLLLVVVIVLYSVPATGVVAAGGPSGGYGGQGIFPFGGTSTLEPSGLPYILTTVCEFVGHDSSSSSNSSTVGAAATTTTTTTTKVSTPLNAAAVVARFPAKSNVGVGAAAGAKRALRSRAAETTTATATKGDVWPYPPKLPSVDFMGRSCVQGVGVDDTLGA